jgi:ERCC4-type nuclease
LAFDIDKIPEDMIIIDSRENKKRIKGIELAAKKAGWLTEVAALETGDYCSKYALVELKAGGDYVSSLLSNRLQNQLNRLELVDKPCKGLLITGRMINPKYSKIAPAAVNGSLASLWAQGLSILKVDKKQEIDIIIRMMIKAQKYNRSVSS